MIGVVVVISLMSLVVASPPRTTTATFGLNQQRTSFTPLKGLGSVSHVAATGVAAVTSPVYTSASNFLLIGHMNVSEGSNLLRLCCTASINGSLVSTPFPPALQNASAVGVPSLASDDRAYVVIATGSTNYMLAFSHSCELKYSLPFASSSRVSMSPIVLADNSVVVVGDGELRVIANSTDPFGGVTLWSTHITSENNIGLALSVDNSTGVLFATYVYASGTITSFLRAMAPLGGGQVGFSTLWTQTVSSSSICSSNTALGCSLSPVVCGSQVLLTTSYAIWAFDQVSGALLWQYKGSFGGSNNQPLCHPAGMIVVVNGTSTLVAFQANSTTRNPVSLWRQSTGAFQMRRTPVIDAMGNIFVIGGASSTSDPNGAKLFAFDSRGNVLITRSTNVPSNQATAPTFLSQPVVFENKIVVAVGELVYMT